MKLQKSDITLNERDALSDMLESEKQLMGFYATAISEGSSKSLRRDFAAHLGTVAENQYSLYTQMSTRGYYTPAPAQKQQIDQTLSAYKTQKKAL